MKKSAKWTYSGDVNMLDYGGKNMRHIGKRAFQVIELINMWDATGEEDQAQYVVELRLVDLDAVSPGNLESALKSCGWEKMEQTDLALAECCDSYGTHAPLGSWSGNNARKLLREAYAQANSLLDPEALESAMDRPVNKIGSSAREFMAGDFMSAIQRGCESGNQDARIMAKMHGIPQETIDDTRPEDFLPYVMGYMAAINGSPKETGEDISPEYFRGYERGQNVKAGKCPAPGWIKQA